MNREPVVEFGHENYRIVKFTHDVELATTLMREAISQDIGQPYDGCLADASKEWIRIVPCLENSYGAMEGWAFEYQNAKPGTRGAFRAVVWAG